MPVRCERGLYFKPVAISCRAKFRARRRPRCGVSPELALAARGYPGPTDSIMKGRARCACDHASLVIAARTVLCAGCGARHPGDCAGRRTVWLLRWPYDDPISTSSLRQVPMSSIQDGPCGNDWLNQLITNFLCNIEVVKLCCHEVEFYRFERFCGNL